MRSHNRHGFSIIEMMIVLAVLMVMAAIGFISLQPALQAAHVSNAYNTTLSAIRQARDFAISERQQYSVTFSNAAVPNTITITQTGNNNILVTYQLPTDVTFTVLAGMPTATNAVPDGFGTGASAIDFDQGIASGARNIIFFMPDGTGQDVNGNLNNGVIYIANSTELYTSRAITVWGATGRVRGWRLYAKGATPYWRQS
jgi:prepilin-type N-terminal cleavage/methylation domain-containing protein